jgi:hypothetical protein
MSKRWKIGLGVAAVLLAAVTALFFFGTSQLNRTIVDTVENYGSAATGTEVYLGDAQISLRNTSGTLKELMVYNPPGFQSDYALRIASIRLDLNLKASTSQLIVLNDVLADGATLNAEQRGNTSNLTEILAHMNAPAEQAGNNAPSGAEPRIIIDRFELTGGRIVLTSDLAGSPQTLDLPDVVVNDIGKSSGGATLDEAAQALLKPIMAAGRSALRTRLESKASEAAKGKLEEAAREKIQELTGQQ